jgi:hypothetical protein
MADKSVSIDLIIKSSEAASSLKEVKQSLKDIKDEMIKAGEGTPAFNKLAAAAGQLKDKVDDANEAIKATNPNKFQALASFASSAAGGVSAVTGAMGLFGAESENVAKTLAKVQSAMALSQGLASLSEMPKAWGSFKTSAVSALNAVKSAIGATGIGLIAIALGAIYAYWDDIKEAVSGVSEEQKKLNKLAKENLKAEQDKYDSLLLSENTLKLQGKTEKEILQLKVAATNEEILKAQIALQNSIDNKKAQVEASERNKEILKGALDFVSIPLTLLLAGIDAIGSAFGKDFGLREGFKESVSNMIFDPKAVATEGDKAIKESQLVLDKLVSQRDGLKNSINAIDKTASDKSKADAKADADDKAKIDEEYRLSQLTAEQKQLEDFTALQKTYLENGNITQGEYNKKIFDKRKELEGDLQVIGLAASEEFKMMKSDDAFTAIQIKQFEIDEITRIEAEQKVKDRVERQTEASAKLAQAQEFVNKLQRISDMAFSVKFAYMKKGAKDEEAVLRAQFKINKALQLSTAIISAAQAQMTILAQYPKFDGGFAMAAAMIGAALMSAGTIAKIAATQFDTTSVSGGGGGGGGGGTDLNTGAATATSNSQPSTLLNPDGTVNNQNTLTPAPIQVYVVESDITSTQTQVAVVQNQMNFH